MPSLPRERVFERSDWARLRAAETVPLHEEDLERLEGINEQLDMAEVEDIYLPVARLVHLRAGVMRSLHDAVGAFVGQFGPNVPFVIGLAGSVAVGKSTAARVLQAVLARAPEHRRVELVTTDGFLFPNAELEARGLMNRKGFPESYDTGALVRFLADLKSGVSDLTVPVYDHGVYDVVAERRPIADRPRIVIVEGLNVLQTPPAVPGHPSVYVSDFFDFSIYVDADEATVEEWYVQRFRALRDGAVDDPGQFFHRFRGLSDAEADDFARSIWTSINLPNLRENVLPTKDRADLVLYKTAGHHVERIHLRQR